ncbi:MAG: arginine repressor [Prevotellaceae bacterium]|nr:arginine repressor [Prevotellaceae bacterium]
MANRQTKNARLEMLKMIVSSQEISTQNELTDELRKTGIDSTQATLSRDLRRLRISKVRTLEGHYVYMLPEARITRSISQTHATVKALHNKGVLNVKFSGNLAVVKTMPGYASHVALDIDQEQLDCVLGTVAGDDTVLVVLDEDTDKQHALSAIAGATSFNF